MRMREREREVRAVSLQLYMHATFMAAAAETFYDSQKAKGRKGVGEEQQNKKHEKCCCCVL